MDSDKVIGEVENVMDMSSVAKNVHVLLVDHNTTSLMLLAAKLEQKRYKVTTTESASFALSLLRERKGFYNIVLADYHMPEMPAIVFAHKILRRCKTTPVLLMATDVSVNMAVEALCMGVSFFFFTKPLQDYNLTGLWQYVVRATGKIPEPQNETTNYYPDIHRNENLSNGGSSSAQNGRGTNLNKNSPTRVNQRRGKNHVSEDSGDSRESDEEKESTKRPRMCWTPSLHNKFLKAIETLGESHVYPMTLLKVMNEPGLTHGQVASHLQKHREKQRNQASTQEVEEQALPPIKLPTQSLFPTANYQAAPKTPSWLNGSRPVCYSLESVKEKLDALGYAANNTLINNGGVQVHVPQGNQVGGQLAPGNRVGAQLGQGINENSHGEQVPWFCQNFSHTGGDMVTNSNPNQEQAQQFSPNFGQLTMTGNNVIPYTNPSGQQATGFPRNFGQVTMTADNLIPNTNPNLEQPTRFPQNSVQVSMETTYMVPTGNQRISGSNILNQEPANNFGMGLSAFGNAGTFENLGEWTSRANQQADIELEGMACDYDIGEFNHIIQDFDASGAQDDIALEGMVGDYDIGEFNHIIQDFDAACGVDPQDPFN